MDCGLERVIALIDPANAPSIAVAERLGMTRDEPVPHPQRPGSLDIYVAGAPANAARVTPPGNDKGAADSAAPFTCVVVVAGDTSP